MPHVIISNAMEAVHDQSLSAIAFIQHSFIEQKNFMVWISMFFDPRYVFLIYAPLLFALSRHVSQKLVITLTITEWSNQILKWFLAGERPYWYVHERADEIVGQRSMLFQLMPNHTALGAPVELRQFPVT
ncbi:Glucose-6-phosphatase 2, partial [Fragariocoptes setiger]